jgi:hypothetical protein
VLACQGTYTSGRDVTELVAVVVAAAWILVRHDAFDLEL